MSVNFSVQNPQNLGGSYSEEYIPGDSRFGWFQKGVRVTYPSSKKIIRCRLLPARDLSLAESDAAFPTSVVAYRDGASGRLDDETKTPAFTAWFTVLLGYTMIGRTRTSFLSPITLSRLGAVNADVRDPLNIIRGFIKDHPRWGALKDQKLGQGKQSSDLIPGVKSGAIANALIFDEQTGAPKEVGIVKFSYAALKALKQLLAIGRPATQNPVGPSEWDNHFMIGDPTAPMTGLVAAIVDQQLGTIRSPAFAFSAAPTFLSGHRAFPIDPNTEAGRKVLADRYHFFSPAVLKVPSFQEIVDWIVEDGAIPYDLVCEALGGMASIPPRPANAPSMVSTPTQPASGFGAPQAPAQGFVSPQGFGAPQAPAQPFGSPQTPVQGFGAPSGSWGATTAPAPTGASPFGAATVPGAWGGAPASPTPASTPAASGFATTAGTWPAPVTQPGTWTPAPNLANPNADVPYPVHLQNPPTAVPSIGQPTVASATAQGQQQIIAPSPAAPAAPTFTPPTVSSEPNFWVHNNGKVEKLTRSQLQQLVNVGGFNLPVMSEDQKSGWTTPASLGITAPMPAAPTALAGAPVPPPAPAVPGAPQPPQMATTGVVTPQPPQQAAPKLTPEERAKLDDFMARITRGEALSPDDLSVYGVLVTKAA